MTTKGDKKVSNPTQNPYCKATTSPKLPWLLASRTGKIQGKLRTVIMSLLHEFCAKHLFTPSAFLITGNKKSKRISYLEQGPQFI